MKTKITLKKLQVLVNLTFLVLISSTAYSQTPMFKNSTYTGGANSIPFNPIVSTFQRCQFVWGPGHFSGSYAGTISKVYFYTASATSTTFNNFVVKMGTSATNPLSGSTWHVTGMQTCINSSTFSMTTSVNGWAVITLQTPITYNPSQFLIIDVSSTGVSSGGFTINQASGISGLSPGRVYGSATASNPSGSGNQTPTFGFDLMRGSNDAGISAITAPLCSPTMDATYSNNGINTIDSVKINWSVNNSLQTQIRYTTPLTSGQKVKVSLSPDYSGFVDGNTYTVKVWTSMPNNKQDTLNDNDTAKITFKYLGPSGTPSTTPSTKCGPGKAPLVCTTPYATDSVIWYDAASGGNKVASGKNTLSPPLFLGVNTFYAQSFKMSGNTKLENNLLGNYTYYTTGQAAQGGYANLTPTTDMFLDSFRIKLYSNNPGSTYSIWMRTGSYVGYQTSSVGWTQIVNNAASKLNIISGYYIATLGVPELMLTKGTTYGFCILSTGTNPVWTFQYNSAGHTVSNSDLSIFTQHYFYGSAPFSGYWSQGYSINLEANYRTAVCPSSRVAAEITVKPSPNGAGFTKGSPFQTTQPNTTGTLSSPDIVAKGDKLTYDLTSPTGYNNSDYGNTWIAAYPVIKSKKGYAIDPKYWQWSPPSGGNPGKLTFSPDKDIVDSLYIISLQIRDLGPYYCDSTIFRHIFVAPRPEPNFSFNSPICDGDAVLFNDKSTISSGGLSYKWDFATGNPADTATINTTVFTFPTFGTYNVKLTTTSTPYGYSESITIPVVVTEIPKIGFKVLNACEKIAVKFNNTTTISIGSVTYNWDFGDPSTTLDKSTSEHTSYTYTNTGAYKVTLKATSNGCTSELTKNANQFPNPVAKFTYPSLICDKSDVQFTNGSTIKMGNMGYSWNFGDGGVSNFASPVHQYTTATPKQVKMKAVSEFGCVDSLIKTITLSVAPTADFTWGAACNLSNTNFSFTGTKPSGYITSFNWNFAGEGTTTLENPSKLFSIVGKKNVTLTLLSNNGCSDVITKEVNVKLQSKAAFEVSDVCEDDDAVFVNQSSVSQGNLLYNWKFGDGGPTSTSTLQSPRHRYIISGVSQTFNVTLVAVVPGGCSDSIIQPISVNAKPNSGFAFTTSGRKVSFIPVQTNNTSYHWRFGDGGNSTVVNPVYDFLNFPSGKYNVCLSVINAAGCFSETCKEVYISGGIDKITKLTGVQVYPNPNKGSFTVTVEDPKSDIAISVFNLLGEVVKTISTNSLKSTYSIDMNVANGVYMVKVTNGGLTSTQKITINK